MRMLSVGYLPEDCSSLVDSGAQTEGFDAFPEPITSNILVSLDTAYPSSLQ